MGGLSAEMMQNGRKQKTCGFTVSMSVNSSRVKGENEKIRVDS